MNGPAWRWSLLWRVGLMCAAAAAGGFALGYELGLLLGREASR